MRMLLWGLAGLIAGLAALTGAALLWMPWAGWQLSQALVWQGPELYRQVPVTETLEDGMVLSIFKPQGALRDVAVISIGLLGTPDVDDRSRPLGNALAQLGYLVVVPHSNAGIAPAQALSCEGVAQRDQAVSRALDYAARQSPSGRALLASVSAGSHEALAAAIGQPQQVSGLFLLNPYDDFGKLVIFTLYGSYPGADGLLVPGPDLATASPVRKMMLGVLHDTKIKPPAQPGAKTPFSSVVMGSALQAQIDCWNFSGAALAGLHGIPATILGAEHDQVVPPEESQALAVRLRASKFSTSLADHFQLLPTPGLRAKLGGAWGIVKAVRQVMAVRAS